MKKFGKHSGMIMALRRIGCLFLALLLVVVELPVYASAAQQDDIDLIRDRLITYFLEFDTFDDGAKVATCYASEAGDYLNALSPNGAWADVAYTSTANAANGAAWGPYLALDRMQAMAVAYCKPGHPYYQDANMLNGIERALLYWGGIVISSAPSGFKGPWSTNWWEHEIGIQLRFSRIGILLKEDLSASAMNVILEKLAWTSRAAGTTGGQNFVWYTQTMIYRYLITDEADKLVNETYNKLPTAMEYTAVSTFDGSMQYDHSFWAHGAQFYSNGYGLSMFRDMSFWIYMLRGTFAAMPVEFVDNMADYMLKSTSWTIRGDIIELYLGYRSTATKYADDYIRPLRRMIESDPNPSHKAQYQAILNNILDPSQSNGKDGNYYMWRSQYAGHMRPGYGVNVKMDSNFTVGGEWRGSWQGTNRGNLITYTASAANTVVVNGDEYRKVYPTFDWTHTPGATAPNTMNLSLAQQGFNNGGSFVAGVSNGKYGATAYEMDKHSTKAKKSYFFFDDEYVALGAGITGTGSSAVHTTLNQSAANGVTVGSAAVPSGTHEHAYTGKWLHNDKIGYVFPQQETFVVSNQRNADYNYPSLWSAEEQAAVPNTFTAYIDHGVKPSNKSYAYIVVPNATAAETGAYANDIPVTIISNTAAIQAVRHDGLKLTQAVFYGAGALEYAPGKTLTVDKPCVLMIDESATPTAISFAVPDNLLNHKVNVTLSGGGEESKTLFSTASTNTGYIGQTQTQAAGYSALISASSSVAGHEARFAKDANLTTYWKSDEAANQWIQFLSENGYVKNLVIDWGSVHATAFSVQVSDNGTTWTTAATVSGGTGGSETIVIERFASYIKIDITGSAGGYEIKEITETSLQNLSEGMTTTASGSFAATSGNPDNVVHVFATDGNPATRWASTRLALSGGNPTVVAPGTIWLKVDLGAVYDLEVLRIMWEGVIDKYRIEVSDDDAIWRLAYEQATSNPSGDNTTQEVKLLPNTKGRFVKFDVTAIKNQYGANIKEFQVFGIDPGYTEPQLMAVTETFDDYAKIDSWGTGWRFETCAFGDSGRYDTSLLVREGTGNGSMATPTPTDYLVYNVQDLYGFELSAYQRRENSGGWINMGYITFEISKDGNIWEPVSAKCVNATGSITTSNSYYNEIYTAKNIPYGYNFLKVIVAGGSRYWAPQLSNLTFYYPADVSVPLSSISLGANRIIVGPDESAVVPYSVQPLNANASVDVSVDKSVADYISGQVIGMDFGETTLQLKSGGVSATCDIIVHPKNISLGKPASSVSGQGSYPASRATDGDLATRWASQYTTGSAPTQAQKEASITIDMEAVTKLTGYAIFWENAYGKEFKIQVSEDNTNWIDAEHVTNNTGLISYRMFAAPLTARYIRMQGIEPSGNYCYSIFEFRVFGVNATLPELNDLVLQAESLAPIYTPAAWNMLQAALAGAKAVSAAPSPTTKQIQDAYDLLDEAVDNLVEYATYLVSQITSVPNPAKGATLLTLPVTVPAGFTVTISGTTPTGIIAADGTITPPDADTSVDIIITITQNGYPATAASTGKLTVTVPKKSERTLKITAPTFDDAAAGYSQPAAKAIVMENIGGAGNTITIKSVTLDPIDADFIIGGSGATIAAGASIDTWNIRPAVGLDAGDYTATIQVLYDDVEGSGITATASVSFKVSDAAAVTIEGYYLNQDDDILITDTDVALDTSETDALASLPAAGVAKLSDESYVDITIDWAFDDPYDSAVKGTVYAATGTVNGIFPAGLAPPDMVGTVTVAGTPVTGVTLDKTELTLAVGESETVTPTVSPDDATNKNVTWASSDATVATAANGLVTAVGKGTAIITVKTVNGSFQAICDVTVTEAEPVHVPVTGVILNQTELTLKLGAFETLIPTVLPLNATDQGVTWRSSGSGIAAVTDGLGVGLVTAIGEGTETIIVTTNDGGFTAECEITVVEADTVDIAVTGVTLNKTSLHLVAGETDTLTATVTPSDAVNKSVAWASSNENAAIVRNGVVVAVEEGTAVITVTTDDGGYTAMCEVTVTAAEPANVPVSGVTLNKTAVRLTAGRTETLTAIVSPAGATDKTVLWTSSNAAVATVADGVVTAIKKGTAIISVATMDGGFTATCDVTVTAKASSPRPPSNSGGSGQTDDGSQTSGDTTVTMTEMLTEAYTSQVIDDAVQEDAAPVIALTGRSSEIQLSGRSLLANAANGNDLAIMKDGIQVALTPKALAALGIGKSSSVVIAVAERTIDENLAATLNKMNPVNKELTKTSYYIALSHNDKKVEKAEQLFKISIDVSDRKLTAAQIKTLTGIYYDGSDIGYMQLGGELSEDGKSFVFYSTYSGEHGLMVSNKLTKIILSADDTAYVVNDRTLQSDVMPYITNGRLLLPLRVIAEALGASVEWNDAEKTVTLIIGAESASIVIGQPLPDGMGVSEIKDERMFVPVRYLAERLGANVVWDDKRRSVRIYK